MLTKIRFMLMEVELSLMELEKLGVSELPLWQREELKDRVVELQQCVESLKRGQ